MHIQPHVRRFAVLRQPSGRNHINFIACCFTLILKTVLRIHYKRSAVAVNTPALHIEWIRVIMYFQLSYHCFPSCLVLSIHLHPSIWA